MTLVNISEKIAQAVMYHVLVAPPEESLDLNEEKLKSYLSKDLQKEIKDHGIIKAEINKANIILTITCTDNLDNLDNLKKLAYKHLKKVYPKLKIEKIKDIIINCRGSHDDISYCIYAIKANDEKIKIAKLSEKEIVELKDSYKNIMNYFKGNPCKPTNLSICIPNDSDNIKFMDNQAIRDELYKKLQKGLSIATSIIKNTAQYIENKGYTLEEKTKKYKIGNFKVTPYQEGWEDMYFAMLEINNIETNSTTKIGFNTASKKLEISSNNTMLKNNDSGKIELNLYHLIESDDLSDIVFYFIKQILEKK